MYILTLDKIMMRSYNLINLLFDRQVGTSSVVYPAAMFAPQVAMRGVPVAEFNMEETPVTRQFG